MLLISVFLGSVAVVPMCISNAVPELQRPAASTECSPVNDGGAPLRFKEAVRLAVQNNQRLVTVACGGLTARGEV